MTFWSLNMLLDQDDILMSLIVTLIFTRPSILLNFLADVASLLDFCIIIWWRWSCAWVHQVLIKVSITGGPWLSLSSCVHSVGPGIHSVIGQAIISSQALPITDSTLGCLSDNYWIRLAVFLYQIFLPLVTQIYLPWQYVNVIYLTEGYISLCWLQKH